MTVGAFSMKCFPGQSWKRFTTPSFIAISERLVINLHVWLLLQVIIKHKLNLSDEEKLKGPRTSREPFKKKEEVFMTSILYFLALFQANCCRGETG